MARHCRHAITRADLEWKVFIFPLLFSAGWVIVVVVVFLLSPPQDAQQARISLLCAADSFSRTGRPAVAARCYGLLRATSLGQLAAAVVFVETVLFRGHCSHGGYSMGRSMTTTTLGGQRSSFYFLTFFCAPPDCYYCRCPNQQARCVNVVLLNPSDQKDRSRSQSPTVLLLARRRRPHLYVSVNRALSSRFQVPFKAALLV